MAIAVLCFLLISAARSEASYKALVGGITVSYSGYASAYYDPTDDTLTVDIYSDYGSLNISIGSTAYSSWGHYVDVYINAHDATLNSISIKANVGVTTYCIPYVCGDVYGVDKFSLQNGVIGNTDYYGLSYGLGMGASYVPKSVSLKNSYSTAQLLGYPNY